MKQILDQALPLEVYSVSQDAYDAVMFKSLAVESAALKTLEEAGLKKTRTFSPLLDDTFSALFKVQPELCEETKLKAAYRMNRTIMERVMQAPSYAELRSYTKLDDLAAAIGTATMGDYLLKQLPDELLDKADVLARSIEKEQDCQEKADALQELGAEKKAAQWREVADEARRAAQSAQADLDESLKDHASTLRQIASQAAKSAVGEVRETMEALEGWGLGPGSHARVPAEERIALAKRVRQSEKLKALAKIIGRFRNLAIACQERKWKVGRDEVYDVTLGSDLCRVLPSELMLLRRPATKLLFYRKFMEGGLLTYALRGQEKVGKGPIVLCLDESISMSGPKELWGKALALGLLEIAAMQKRDFVFVAFGNQSESKEWRFEKGRVTPADLIDLAEYFLNGGTDFERPLTIAQVVIEQDPTFKHADIVFITDGECGISDLFLDSFMAWKKKSAVTIHGILVDRGTTSPTTVSKFADTVHFASVFSMEEGESLARETFLTI